MTYKALFAVLGFLASVGVASAASVTVYTAQSDYLAATSGEVFSIDFDGLPSGASDGVFTGVDFGTIGASTPGNVLFGSNAMTDAGNPASLNNVGVMQGALTVPTQAMSMEILSGGILGFDLFSGGSLLASVSFSTSFGFFGLVSDMAFDGFALVPNTTAPFGPDRRDRVFIDTFTVDAVAPVPLPASVLLLGLGVGALGAMRRKAA